MDIFDSIAPTLIADKEGGYTNNPADKGGPTKFGITEARARAAGFTGSMRDLTYTQAIAILRLYYWQQPQFSALADVSPSIAKYCFDVGMNLGVTWPGRFLQRALNVLSDDLPLTVDGNAFALSRYRLNQFLRARGPEGEAVLLGMIRAQASVRYMEIAEGDAAQKGFEYGWQRARAQVAQTVKA